MARAYRGPYARPSSVLAPYATAAVWGTGVNAVHGYYGEGPPLRVLGRTGAQGASPVAVGRHGEREYQQPADSSGDSVPQEITWGYPAFDDSPDSFGQGPDAPISATDAAPGQTFFMDDHPSWNEPTEQERVRRTSKMPSWGQGGRFFRAVRMGAARYRLYPLEDENEGGHYAPVSAEQPNSLPTETVSEGWINKTTSFLADASPSDPSQYEVQSSMRQRYGTRDNLRAQARSTDDPRSRIESRVAGMIEKVYSTGERSYDMFPYQIDQIERPFRYRTAGVGPAEWMTTNEYNSLTAVQRTPPPDPAMGVPEVQEPDAYGYTGEDTMYYG
jgi:hypothetical protein